MSLPTAQHSYWMNRALVLARKGFGHVHPNPMVGAVVLDAQGNCVGEGYHAKFGGDHAEIVALKQAGVKSKGGTLYVSLEPCCHHGKTPPCVEAILKAGIKHVIAACCDANPKVAGKGIEALRQKGVTVDVGVESEKALNINKPFFHWMNHKRPFVRAKVAMTVDGILGHQDQRLLLSSKVLEKTTMKLRAQAQAVIIGVNTVMIDQPRLNVRGEYADIQPIRVIIDSTLRTSATSEMFETKGGAVWIFCDEQKKDSKKWKQLSSLAKLIPIPTIEGRVDPKPVIEYLGAQGITSILIEGGATILQSFADQKLIDEWIIYLNSKNLKKEYPQDKLIGFVSNPLFSLKYQSVIRSANDLLIIGTPSVNQ